jgi:hypothetical protein
MEFTNCKVTQNEVNAFIKPIEIKTVRGMGQESPTGLQIDSSSSLHILQTLNMSHRSHKADFCGSCLVSVIYVKNLNHRSHKADFGRMCHIFPDPSSVAFFGFKLLTTQVNGLS